MMDNTIGNRRRHTSIADSGKKRRLSLLDGAFGRILTNQKKSSSLSKDDSSLGRKEAHILSHSSSPSPLSSPLSTSSRTPSANSIPLIPTTSLTTGSSSEPGATETRNRRAFTGILEPWIVEAGSIETNDEAERAFLAGGLRCFSSGEFPLPARRHDDESSELLWITVNVRRRRRGRGAATSSEGESGVEKEGRPIAQHSNVADNDKHEEESVLETHQLIKEQKPNELEYNDDRNGSHSGLWRGSYPSLSSSVGELQIPASASTESELCDDALDNSSTTLSQVFSDVSGDDTSSTTTCTSRSIGDGEEEGEEEEDADVIKTQFEERSLSHLSLLNHTGEEADPQLAKEAQERLKKRHVQLKKRSEEMKRAFEEKYKRIREGYSKSLEEDKLLSSYPHLDEEAPHHSPDRVDNLTDEIKHDKSKNDVWKLLHFELRKKKLPLIKERAVSASALSSSGLSEFSATDPSGEPVGVAESSHNPNQVKEYGRRKPNKETKREKEREREREKEKEREKEQQNQQRRSYSVSSFIRRGSTKKIGKPEEHMTTDVSENCNMSAQKDEKRERAMRDFEATLSNTGLLPLEMETASGPKDKDSATSGDSSLTSTITSQSIKRKKDTTEVSPSKSLDARQSVPTLAGRRRGKSDTKPKNKPKTWGIPLVSRRKNSFSGQQSLYCSDDMREPIRKIGSPTRLSRDRCQSHDSNILRLQRCNLSTIDAQKLGKFAGLHFLYLNNNSLRFIPNTIGRLTRLKELYLSHNVLEKLPPEIGYLIRLETLDVSSNHLQALPPEIGHLERLRVLHIENNQITRLPDEMGRLFQLFNFFYDNNPLIYPRKELFERGVQEVLSFLRVSTRLRDCRELCIGSKSQSFTTDDIPGFFDMVVPRTPRTTLGKGVEPQDKDQRCSSLITAASEEIVDGLSENQDDGLQPCKLGNYSVRPRRQSEGGAATARKTAQRRNWHHLTPPLPPIAPSASSPPTESVENDCEYDQQLLFEEEEASLINDPRDLRLSSPIILSVPTERITQRATLSNSTSALSLSVRHRSGSRRGAIAGFKTDSSAPNVPSSLGRGPPASPTLNKRDHRHSRSSSRGSSFGDQSNHSAADRETEQREAEREAKRLVDRILSHYTSSISADHPLSIFKKVVQAPIHGIP